MNGMTAEKRGKTVVCFTTHLNLVFWGNINTISENPFGPDGENTKVRPGPNSTIYRDLDVP